MKRPRTDTVRTRRWVLLILVVVFSAAFGFATIQAATAQEITSSELLRRYMQARTSYLAERDAKRAGQRIAYRDFERIPNQSDSLRAWLQQLEHDRLAASLPDPLELFRVQSWTSINRLEAPVYKDSFDSTRWAFTGSNSRSLLDTLRTRDIRSRLQDLFGAPTKTLVEMGYPDSLLREQVIEFEYWFALNDSINVIVLDVNGPWDRGIVLAADMRFRSSLSVIKEQFLGQLIPKARRRPFTDYYYNVDQQTWYLTGFDGASYFDQRIDRPDLSTGRPAPILALETEADPIEQSDKEEGS